MVAAGLLLQPLPVFLPCSASAQQVPRAPGPAGLPLQAQLPGEWISSAALPGAPVRKLDFLT